MDESFSYQGLQGNEAHELFTQDISMKDFIF
jgi:hypothetical protein